LKSYRSEELQKEKFIKQQSGLMKVTCLNVQRSEAGKAKHMEQRLVLRINWLSMRGDEGQKNG